MKNWKETDLRKFLKWILTFVQEDNGQGSSKRAQSVIWAVALWQVIGRTLDLVATGKIQMWEAIAADITIFGFIAVLLGLATYSDLKFSKNVPNEVTK